MRDPVAELTIETFALEVAELRKRGADLEADVVRYRELALAAIAALAEAARQKRAADETIARLRDEFREFRARVMAGAARRSAA